MQQPRSEEEAQHPRQGPGLCCVTSLIRGHLQSGCHALRCQPLCPTCQLVLLLVHLWCMPSGPLHQTSTAGGLWGTLCDHCE